MRNYFLEKWEHSRQDGCRFWNFDLAVYLGMLLLFIVTTCNLQVNFTYKYTPLLFSFFKFPTKKACTLKKYTGIIFQNRQKSQSKKNRRHKKTGGMCIKFSVVSDVQYFMTIPLSF